MAVIQTSLGFLITYSIVTDQKSRVYQLMRDNGHTRRQSNADRLAAEEEQRGLPEVNIRFRMVIKVDAGISKVLALDEELIVATDRPPAVQCIKWTPDKKANQTTTELVSRMAWIQKKSKVLGMVYDRAMSLAIWITSDGRAYAVQRLATATGETEGARRLFRGYGFHIPNSHGQTAIKSAINARFSLLAVATASSEIVVYTARDYAGSIPLSHRLEAPASFLSTGMVTSLTYSPDGYCLFAGFEKGWAMWSVYGKLQGSTFAADQNLSEANDEGWLRGVSKAAWLGSGTSVLLTRNNDHRLWLVEMVKSAASTCFCSANVSRTLLLTQTSLMIYRGFDLPLSATLSSDASLWHNVQIPSTYLAVQGPIRSAVISSDGRYIAVAGRRGLAHYSVFSGRWKVFDDSLGENAFVVRGGMCWYQHVLIVAAETDGNNEVKILLLHHSFADFSSFGFTQESVALTILRSFTSNNFHLQW